MMDEKEVDLSTNLVLKETIPEVEIIKERLEEERMVNLKSRLSIVQNNVGVVETDFQWKTTIKY